MTKLLALLGLCGIAAVSQPAPDAARVLGEMRHALGGDAALAGVQTFSVTGTETRTVAGHQFGGDVELLCALPDRFVRIRRSSGPFNSVITEASGVSGDALIRRRDSSLPYPPDPGANDTASQRAKRERRSVLLSKHEFARVAIALVGQAAGDPAPISAEMPEVLDGTPVNVLLLQSPDGYAARLFVDAGTHLPIMIQWQGARGFVMSSSSTVTVHNGQVVGVSPASPVGPVPDPSGTSLVEHRLYYSDFRTSDGLNWPHRFKEVVDGRVEVDTRLGKFRINPRIDPKVFDPAGNS